MRQELRTAFYCIDLKNLVNGSFMISTLKIKTSQDKDNDKDKGCSVLGCFDYSHDKSRPVNGDRIYLDPYLYSFILSDLDWIRTRFFISRTMSGSIEDRVSNILSF